MKPYRIIFSDIDGTLLDSNHQLPKQTGEKIYQLWNRGIPFVLVSARMPDGILPIQQELGIRAPIVSYSGALIWDEEKQPIFSCGMSLEQAEQLLEEILTLAPGVCCWPYSGSCWMTEDPLDSRAVFERQVTGLIPKQGRMRQLLDADAKIHKLLCIGTAWEIAELEKQLKLRYPDFSIARSQDCYLEIMASGATKANAAKFLCDYLGIPIAQSMAFGDNVNDLCMLEACGLGVAMGNAPEQVQKRADRVTLTNDQQGLLAVLEEESFCLAHHTDFLK